MASHVAAGCVLTPVAGAAGFWKAVPGTVALMLEPETGSVAIDAGNSSVSDVTDYLNPQPVAFTATTDSFSFVAVAGRKYQVSLVCTLLPDPYAAKAVLKESPCGQVVDTISYLNMAPGLKVQA